MEGWFCTGQNHPAWPDGEELRRPFGFRPVSGRPWGRGRER